MEIERNLEIDKFKAQKLKTALKRQLRAKKMKYHDLADHLQCSVPTVKRILGDEELSLSRLLEILQFLDLNLTELDMLSAQDEAKAVTFSREQEEFLAKNPHFFGYLSRLYSGESPEEIAKKFGLTQLSTNKYLLGLEKLELIRVTGRQKVKTAHRQIPHLGRGLLAKAYYEAFIRTSADFFIKTVGEDLYAQEDTSSKKPPRGFTIHSGKITPEAYQQYVTQQKKLFEDFANQSTYQEKAYEKDKLCTYVLMNAVTTVGHEHPALTKLTDVFGQVTNL